MGQYTDYDSFMNGSRKNSHNAVIIPIYDNYDPMQGRGDKEIKADDIEMQCDYYAYYGTAPVVAWVFREDLNEAMKPLIGSHHKVFLFNPKEKEAGYKKTLEAAEWLKTEKDRIFENEVRTAFYKFDKD